MAAPIPDSITISLRLSRALGFARTGKLREAQQLLASAGTLPESAVELHALAALATGEGDFSRALRLWRLLLQREPGHAEAKRMIDVIELWLSRPSWYRFIPFSIAALVVALALVIFLKPGTPPAAAPQPPPARSTVVAPPRTYTPPREAPPMVAFPPPQEPTQQRRRNR
jgi:hypothetical protein